MNLALDQIGFPLCTGDVMAGNRRWCLSLAEWQERFSAWIRSTDPEAVLHAAIFFDFRPVYGDATLAERLRDWFFRHARDAAVPPDGAERPWNRPPLGIIRDFRFETRRDLPHTLDLKLYGLRPSSKRPGSTVWPMASRRPIRSTG